MRPEKTILFFFTAWLALMAAAGCGKDDGKDMDPPVEEVIVEPESLTLNAGESCRLNVTVLPPEAASAVVKWSCDNNSVATVTSEGLVTAVAAGEANVTAMAGDRSAVCTVTVIEGGQEPEPEPDNLYEIDMAGMSADEVRAAISEALAGGNTGIRLIGDFYSTGIPADASVMNQIWNENPFYNTDVEIIDLSEVTGWPEVDIDGLIDNTTYQPAPDGVYGLPSYAFYGLASDGVENPYPALREVILPDGMEAIGAYAFTSCKALASVKAPGATGLGGFAFMYCTALEEAVFPAAVTVYTYAFASSGVKSLTLPNALNFGYAMLDGCNSLKELSITAAGNMTIETFPMLGYYLFNFETSSCRLTLNSDKHFSTGSAEPAALSETQWAADANGNPLTWSEIVFE